MDTTTFFDNFDRLAEAPNGVAKLREFILQMAVSGKLVPQDPNDEPVDLMILRITAGTMLRGAGRLSRSLSGKKLSQFARATQMIWAFPAEAG